MENINEKYLKYKNNSLYDISNDKKKILEIPIDKNNLLDSIVPINIKEL